MKRSSLQRHPGPLPTVGFIDLDEQVRMPTRSSESAEHIDILTQHVDTRSAVSIHANTRHGHLKKMLMLAYPSLHCGNPGHVHITGQ